MFKDQEKAVFSAREKIIPDVIRIVDLVLGFFIAKSQEVNDSFNDVISGFRGQPEGYQYGTKK
jgi:hypothetical protein